MCECVCVCVCVCVLFGLLKKEKGRREGRKGRCEGRGAFVGVISERPTKHPCRLCQITTVVRPSITLRSGSFSMYYI